MPHIILDITPGLLPPERTHDLLARLVTRLGAFPTVDIATVKARIHRYEAGEFAVGAGHPAGFAHLTVQILEGRPGDLRGKIADALWSELRDAFHEPSAAGEVNVTLELREMARETYRK
ncbi:MAG: hypothetical protein C4320_05650 [Armatimonadota bacterium]